MPAIARNAWPLAVVWPVRPWPLTKTWVIWGPFSITVWNSSSVGIASVPVLGLE